LIVYEKRDQRETVETSIGDEFLFNQIKNNEKIVIVFIYNQEKRLQILDSVFCFLFFFLFFFFKKAK